MVTNDLQTLNLKFEQVMFGSIGGGGGGDTEVCEAEGGGGGVDDWSSENPLGIYY